VCDAEFEQMNDELADILEQRVTALEEILAARWPRRVVTRARLRRQIRRSVSGFSGPFAGRRIEALSCEWLSREGTTSSATARRAVPISPPTQM
jgi:hypothetical protein